MNVNEMLSLASFKIIWNRKTRPKYIPATK